MEELVHLEDVHKVYPMGNEDVRALDGVSFVIHEGEYVAVMGSSGSGKSTLLNLLGCLDHPTSGRYLLGGQDVSRFDGGGYTGDVSAAMLADLECDYAIAGHSEACAIPVTPSPDVIARAPPGAALLGWSVPSCSPLVVPPRQRVT